MRSHNERATAGDEAASAPPDTTGDTASVTAADGGAVRSVKKGRSTSKRLAIRTRSCDDFFEDCAGPRGIKLSSLADIT